MVVTGSPTAVSRETDLVFLMAPDGSQRHTAQVTETDSAELRESCDGVGQEDPCRFEEIDDLHGCEELLLFPSDGDLGHKT